jgi:hypothetical protein
MARAVAVKDLMVSKRWAPEDQVRTRVVKREPAEAGRKPRQLEFVFSKSR